MRLIALACGAILLAAQQTLAQHVPFQHFYISVEIADGDYGSGSNASLHVSAQCRRKPDAPFHHTAVDVLCHKFDASHRGFTPQEQAVFMEAARAAEERRSFTQTVASLTVSRRKLRVRLSRGRSAIAGTSWCSAAR